MTQNLIGGGQNAPKRLLDQRRVFSCASNKRHPPELARCKVIGGPDLCSPIEFPAEEFARDDPALKDSIGFVSPPILKGDFNAPFIGHVLNKMRKERPTGVWGDYAARGTFGFESAGHEG